MPRSSPGLRTVPAWRVRNWKLRCTFRLPCRGRSSGKAQGRRRNHRSWAIVAVRCLAGRCGSRLPDTRHFIPQSGFDLHEHTSHRSAGQTQRIGGRTGPEDCYRSPGTAFYAVKLCRILCVASVGRIGLAGDSASPTRLGRLDTESGSANGATPCQPGATPQVHDRKNTKG